jgi:hypothetical protein
MPMIYARAQPHIIRAGWCCARPTPALTAVPVARRLGVTRPARTRLLLVDGDDWVVDLGRALQLLGLDVLMWAGFDEAAITFSG